MSLLAVRSGQTERRGLALVRPVSHSLNQSDHHVAHRAGGGAPLLACPRNECRPHRPQKMAKQFDLGPCFSEFDGTPVIQGRQHCQPIEVNGNVNPHQSILKGLILLGGSVCLGDAVEPVFNLVQFDQRYSQTVAKAGRTDPRLGHGRFAFPTALFQRDCECNDGGANGSNCRQYVPDVFVGLPLRVRHCIANEECDQKHRGQRKQIFQQFPRFLHNSSPRFFAEGIVT